MTKIDVENILQANISDENYEQALEYAKRKQNHIYKMEKRPEVMQPWYLAQLTAEYVHSLAFSKFTMDLCEKLRNMEKSVPSEDRNTPVATILYHS